MTGVSALTGEPFGCLGVNATLEVCRCETNLTAQSITTNLTLPPQPSLNVISLFGWIIVHQKFGFNNWSRPWVDYRNGFGSIDSDFWMGLERLYLLTGSGGYRMRFEMQLLSTGLWYSAEYWSFTVGDEATTKYRLNVSGYSGDAGDGLQYQAQSAWTQNGMSFTTVDHDNDHSGGNCAATYGGGMWFNSCYYACFTCFQSVNGWCTAGANPIQVSRMMVKAQ
jgi:hypothetical protein